MLRHTRPFTAAALLTGLLLGSPPARAQTLPTVTLAAPAAAAAGRVTRASLTFTLPTGYRLLYPRLRVLDSKGEIVELLPTYVTRRSPTGSGYRDLHTGRYRSGTYQLRAEVDFLDAAGKRGAVASPFVPFVK